MTRFATWKMNPVTKTQLAILAPRLTMWTRRLMKRKKKATERLAKRLNSSRPKLNWLGAKTGSMSLHRCCWSGSSKSGNQQDRRRRRHQGADCHDKGKVRGLRLSGYNAWPKMRKMVGKTCALANGAIKGGTVEQ